VPREPVITLPCAEEPRVSILVVATVVGERLRRCLRSIALAAPLVAFDTTVLLDGVAAEQAEALRSVVSGVRVEAFTTNLGLAGVLNRGREFAGGEFFVMLQDDTEVRAGWLDALVAAADRDPGAGAVGSLVLNPDGSVQSAGYGLTSDFIPQAPWGDSVPDPADFVGVRAVDYGGSCSLLVRTATWDRIGGADERVFPLYPVDIDLCLAIRMRGERVLCEPASVLLHERGASTHSDYAGFVQRRNRELMLEKWSAVIVGHVACSGATAELPPSELPLQVRERDPELQARAQLIRAVETFRAYSSDLRARLEGREAEVTAVWQRNVYLEERNAALEDNPAGEAGPEASAAADTSSSSQAELAWLRERSDTLARLEAGRWWRLRSQLRSLFAAALRVPRSPR
jgi:GT2 family glycosyltransferase